MIIETFRLVDGADEAAFLAADERVQEEFSPNLEGFVRRTTARGSDGEWAVVTLWATEEAATAARQLAASDPVVAEFQSFVEPTSYSARWFEELPG